MVLVALLDTFFQKCWNIVVTDVVEIVKTFFSGHTFLKFSTYINLMLLPKKERVQSFTKIEPTSLSNLLNKVISKIIYNKLEIHLSSIISQNEFDLWKSY